MDSRVGSMAVSAFGDEISTDFLEQLDLLCQLGINLLDLRSAFSKHVLDLNDKELDCIAEHTKVYGVGVHCIASNLNKGPSSDIYRKQELHRMVRAIEIANHLHATKIRFFSPVSPSTLLQEERTFIADWLIEQASLGYSSGVKLLLENDRGLYGSSPANTNFLMRQLSPHGVGAIFDIGNAILSGYRTFPDWLPWILPYLDTVHVKDAVFERNEFVAAGDGDGQFVQVMQLLKGSSWGGVLTVEPHLGVGRPESKESFRYAVQALRETLRKADSVVHHISEEATADSKEDAARD